MHKLAVSHLTAKDVMVKSVISFTHTTTILEAVELLLQHRISGAPVIDPKTGVLLSVASELDLMRLLAMAPMSHALLTHMDKLPLQEELITISPESPYSEVFKLFLTHKYRRIFVVEKNRKLLGVISRRDIIRTIIQEEKKKSSP